MKRENFISWDDMFMSIAMVASQRSKDPSTQHGACIVKDNKIIGIGYNGFPNGCSDDELPWGRDDKDIYNTKYPYVVHGEMNACINVIDNNALKGATIYVTGLPCPDCTKNIIQFGIKEIVVLNKNYKKSPIDYRPTERLIKCANIKFRIYESKTNNIEIDLSNGKIEIRGV